MKYIKFLSSLTGHHPNTQTLFSFSNGDCAEWDDAEADRMADRGIAEILSSSRAAELKSSGTIFRPQPTGRPR